MSSLRDSGKELARFDVSYFMVSLDSAEKNAEFAASVGADMVLLSDPTKEAARAYGVLALGGLYAKRRTFFIDPEGVIRHVDNDVDTKSHGRDIVRKLEELGWQSSTPGEAAGAAGPGGGGAGTAENVRGVDAPAP